MSLQNRNQRTMKKNSMTRRTALATLAATPSVMLGTKTLKSKTEVPKTTKGRLKQGVSRWCFGRLKLDELSREAKAMGIAGIDLIGPDDWHMVQKNGLTCSMANGPGSIKDGWNTPESHDKLIREAKMLMPKMAAAGLKNMIVMSGNRRGISDAAGIENCVRGLEKIIPLAESLDITLHMELLNSKRDHKGYHCDHTAWGVAVAKKLGTPRFKLLYDIYHMQIMEGDIIATIQENIAYIGHFHTGGVPGRNEIDETQELNYRRICEAIADTGFDGYLSHEFVPWQQDALSSLRRAVKICTV